MPILHAQGFALDARAGVQYDGRCIVPDVVVELKMAVAYEVDVEIVGLQSVADRVIGRPDLIQVNANPYHASARGLVSVQAHINVRAAFVSHLERDVVAQVAAELDAARCLAILAHAKVRLHVEGHGHLGRGFEAPLGRDTSCCGLLRRRLDACVSRESRSFVTRLGSRHRFR
eukprot:scaffold261_cov336-Pavlova_lutheri.AAC.33